MGTVSPGRYSVLHSVVHMKSATNYCEKELEREIQSSPQVCSAGQSQCEVCVNVGLLVFGKLQSDHFCTDPS